MKHEFRLNLEHLNEIVCKLPCEGVVLLRGTLASGKTTLVREVAKFRGAQSEVTSPTFSVMQIYDCADGTKIYHYDIYQKGVAGLVTNGLFENLFEDGLHLVEWGDEELEKMLAKYGIKFYKINIILEGNARKYEVESA